MSINPRQCPFLVAVQVSSITCRELVPGCAIKQGFSSPRDKAAHYTQYCTGDYYLCPVAAELNAVYHEYDDSPCPYNWSVLCFFKEDCGKCGWNPETSLERLKRLYPMCSPESLRALLGQN